MTCSFASDLVSKIATFDKDSLAAVVFELLLGVVVIKSIFSSLDGVRKRLLKTELLIVVTYADTKIDDKDIQ